MRKYKLIVILLTLALSTNSLLFSQDNFDRDNSVNADNKTGNNILQETVNISGIPKAPEKHNNIGMQNIDATTFYTVIPNDGGSSQNPRAPQGGRRYIRTVYLIKPSEMAAFGTGGDLITHIAWEYLTNNLNFGQSIPTKCDSLKIWFENTTSTTNAKSTTWATAISTMSLVYRGNYIIPSGEFGQNVFVNLGGTGTVPFTTVAGNGLYVAFEYTNNSPGLIASSTAAANVTCNFQGLTGGCLTGTSQTAHATTMTASNFRPVTYLGKGSPADVTLDIANVSSIYLLSQAMVCPSPDSNKITIVIDHLRASADVLNVNTKVLKVGGGLLAEWDDVINSSTISNTYLTKMYKKSAEAGSIDSVLVTVSPVSGENVTFNNAAYALKYNTLNTAANYDDIDLFAFGGVGFTANSGEMVNRFHTAGAIKLTSVEYGFLAAAASGLQPYQIKVYAGDSVNKPGTLLYTSPTMTSPAGTSLEVDASYTFPVPISIPAGDYYVALVQTGTTNIGFAYYGEGPIRPNVFYLTIPAGSTVWTEFSQVPSNMFNVRMIVHSALQLELGAWLEGFFDGASQIGDTITIIAHDLNTLANLDTAKAYVGSGGTGIFNFAKLNSTTCYIYEVRHRNHIATWSHDACEKLDVCGKSYNFRSSINSAYGDNLVFVTSGFAFFTGDVNQDEIIDASDLSMVENAIDLDGYVPEDVNGDDYVDASDVALVENNQGVEVLRP